MELARRLLFRYRWWRIRRVMRFDTGGIDDVYERVAAARSIQHLLRKT
jgi:hypothetical protein